MAEKNKETQEGSKPGFVLCLIGGILGFGFSIYLGFAVLSGDFSILNFLGYNEDILDLTIYLFQVLQILIIGLLFFFNFILFGVSFKLKRDEELKKASKVCFIVSLFSLNILGLIGSVFGLVKKIRK